MKTQEKDLTNFIYYPGDLVHPNVLKMVKKRDNEGIIMALNQIHYGSLKVSREIKMVKQNEVKKQDVKDRDDNGDERIKDNCSRVPKNANNKNEEKRGLESDKEQKN